MVVLTVNQQGALLGELFSRLRINAGLVMMQSCFLFDFRCQCEECGQQL